MKRTISKFQLLLLAPWVLLAACTNLSEKTGLTTTNPSTLIGSSTTIYTHTLNNISTTVLSGGSSNIEITLAANTSLAGYQPLPTFCAVAGGALACSCEITWSETNTVGGTATSYSRTKKAALTDVQAGSVKCQVASVGFWNDINDGTSLKFRIVPSSTNTTGLNTKSVTLKKGGSTTANGDFIDDSLTPFRNIYRYTCNSRRTAGHEILNQYVPTPPSSGVGPTYNVLLASRFCTGDSATNCTTPRNGFSAQSYYRNLLVRSDKLGEINSKNSFYDCPKIEESISYSAGQTIPAAEKQKYWPLDTTFCLGYRLFFRLECAGASGFDFVQKWG